MLTNSDIDNFTKKWLKNSKDRDGGREQRAKARCLNQEYQTEQSVGENAEK